MSVRAICCAPASTLDPGRSEMHLVQGLMLKEFLGGRWGWRGRFSKAVPQGSVWCGQEQSLHPGVLECLLYQRNPQDLGWGDPQAGIGWSPTTVSQFVHLEPRGCVYQAMGSGPTGRIGVLRTVPGWGELWCPQFPKLLTTFLSLQGSPAHLVSYPFLPSLSSLLLPLPGSCFLFQGCKEMVLP